MKEFSQFMGELQERYYAPNEKLPSGKTPYGKSRSSYFRNKRKANDQPTHEDRMRHLGRSIKQIQRSYRQVRHGADNPNFNPHPHPDAVVHTDGDDEMRVTSKGIKYHVYNTGRKTKEGKPIHGVTWNHSAGRDHSMSDTEKRQVARDAKSVWNTHVQHRIPHGSVLSNQPVASYKVDKKKLTVVKTNPRAKLYQRAGFGPIQTDDKQYASVGREPSPKQRAKGKTRLSPINSVE